MSELQAINSVFNIEIEKIDPNPDQPRKHFSQESLNDLAESIRRYGVMQPITVVRRESQTADGGITTRYEIIAGERRWRASIVAGMASIPAIIREAEETEQERFELSILENLQREDLNPVDKARSFARLSDDFGMKHAEIADKLGKSREYVTNSLRLLALPDNVLDALSAGLISEGHTRPLLSLKDKADELQVLFNEITSKSLTVRDAEKTARELSGNTKKASRYNTAQVVLDPEMESLQAQLAQSLGTTVSIDKKEKGGKLTIDFFSRDDLKKLISMVGATDMADMIASKNLEQTTYAEPAAAEPIAMESGAIIMSETITPAAEPIVDEPAEQARQAVTPTDNHEAVDGRIQVDQLSSGGTEADLLSQGPQYNPTATKKTGDDFGITPRTDGIVLDESLAGKDIVTQSAHVAPLRSETDTQAVVSSKTQALQNEINSLAAMTPTAKETANPANAPKHVDLGELELHTPEYAQPVYTPQTQAEQPTISTGQYVKSESGNFVQAMSGAGSAFVPQEPAAADNVDVSVTGSEFVPDNTVDAPAQNSAESASTAQVTMGGLGNMFGGVGPKDPPKTDDPYRLDNFSI